MTVVQFIFKKNPCLEIEALFSLVKGYSYTIYLFSMLLHTAGRKKHFLRITKLVSSNADHC